ncbi:MAG TPA: hypothetical protein PLK41_08830 [Defluviitoga tunisiensis]|nr:hypothetical protein [Defluviitoga tunisiensis]
MNFSKDRLLKQMDTAIRDLQHLLVSMEEFQENEDSNKLQKKVEDLEKEIKWWQDRYNELYRMYSDLFNIQQRHIVLMPYQPYIYPSKTLPNENIEPFYVSESYSPDSSSHSYRTLPDYVKEPIRLNKSRMSDSSSTEKETKNES